VARYARPSSIAPAGRTSAARRDIRPHAAWAHPGWSSRHDGLHARRRDPRQL